MTWPPIPSLIRGSSGPIKVRRVKKAIANGQDCWGHWNDAKRLITIDKTAAIEFQWRVLFHELAHAALSDAGTENLMEDQAVEAVCDAVATARMQELRGELGIIDS